MNIKDLKPSEYKVIGQPMNINSLPQGSYKNVSDVIQQNTIQKDKQKSLMEKLGERAGNIVGIMQKPQDIAGALTGEKQIQAAGQVAGGIGDVIGAGLGWAGGKVAEMTPKSIKEPIKKAGVAILQSPVGQEGLKAIQGGVESYNSWKQANPRIAQDLEAVVNIASILPVGKAGQVLKKKVLETSVAKNYIKQQAEKTAIKTAKEFDNLAGTITQGKVKDIPIAQKALSNIDITGIKTYKDAVNVVENKIGSIATKLDDALLTDKTVRSIELLTYKNHNFVDDALKQLDNFYTKVNDVDKKTVINSIATKAKTQGLTVKEINDIARMHGQDLNAFNASGELASGLTKQAAENTRTGVKDTAKALFKNPVYDAADKEMASLIRVKDLFKNQVEAVNKLQQKIMERSLGEKVGRMVSRVVNTLGGNAPKGAVEFFLGRGTGLKTINAVEMEKMLQKNLQKLQKIANEKLSDKQLIKELERIVNDLPSTPPILPPVVKPKTSPLNLKKNELDNFNLPQNNSNVNTLSTTSQKYIPPEDLIKKTIKYEGGWKTIIEQKSTGKEIANIGSSPAYGKELLKNGYPYQSKTSLPIKSNPLIQEAKKYKTAEEFVKNYDGGLILDREKVNNWISGGPDNEMKVSKLLGSEGKKFMKDMNLPDIPVRVKEAGENTIGYHARIEWDKTKGIKSARIDIEISPTEEFGVENLASIESNLLHELSHAKQLSLGRLKGQKVGSKISETSAQKHANYILTKTKSQLTDIWKKVNKK